MESISPSEEQARKYAIAYFITPHGFGHAARASAVMNAITSRAAAVSFHLFTSVPEWVFSDSLQTGFTYHHWVTDVGIIQSTPLEEDLPETAQRLSQLYPLQAAPLNDLASQLQELDIRLVICDIAPLGIAAAEKAGIPSVLVENFTWDWIYQGYVEKEPGLQPFIDILQELFSKANIRYRTKPFCGSAPLGEPVNVLYREPRSEVTEMRTRLGAAPDQKIALVTMGGIEQQYGFLDRLIRFKDFVFVVPAASEEWETRANLVLLPHHTPVYHPDLVYASDVVIGKVGYSTLAEVYHAGIPFAYVPRLGFRETPCLTEFIRANMTGFEISPNEFSAGDWVERLPEMVNAPRRKRAEENGARQIADRLVERGLILPGFA